MDHERLYATFLAIARTGAVSRAARQIGCSAAAASRQLDALETHLGVRLFDRTTRSVRLSAAGQRLLPQAEAVLHTLIEARRSVDAQRVQASVRVCAPTALGVEWVADSLAELAPADTGMRVELILDNRPTDAWAEGVDVLVRSGMSLFDEPADLVVRQVGAFSLGIYAGPDLAARAATLPTPDALADLPWIGHTGFALARGLSLRRGARESVLRAQPALSSSDLLAVARMAEHGSACAVLPHWLARPRVAAGLLHALLPDWELPAAQVWLAWRNRGSNRQAISRVAHHLRRGLAARLRA